MIEKLKIILATAVLLCIAGLAHHLAGSPGQDALFDPQGNTFIPHNNGLLAADTGLGVLLLGAWFFGKLAAGIGLSKISGFLVFGALVGPGG